MAAQQYSPPPFSVAVLGSVSSGKMGDSELAMVTPGEEAQKCEERQEFSLPRADGGKDAWLVLFACFVLEALVWGWSQCNASVLVRLP